VPFLAFSGNSMAVSDDCTGCGLCAEPKGCPFHAIHMNEDATRAVIDPARCMGCSACECPEAKKLKYGQKRGALAVAKTTTKRQ